MGTYKDTRWGVVCAALFDEVKGDFPALSDHYGPDGVGLTKDQNTVTFELPAETTVAPLRAGHPWDRMLRIKVTLWLPDPVTAELAWERFLRACNKLQHGRACMPEGGAPAGGTIGERGAKYVGTIRVRLPVHDPAPRTAVPESSEIGAEVKSPTGAVEGASLVVG